MRPLSTDGAILILVFNTLVSPFVVLTRILQRVVKPGYQWHIQAINHGYTAGSTACLILVGTTEGDTSVLNHNTFAQDTCIRENHNICKSFMI